MAWDQARLADELPFLDRMAQFKYDEYQQFAPGQKFVENLGLWLGQFASQDEREMAYEFVRRRLVFMSSAEMRHLVEAAFSDVIKSRIVRQAASVMGLPPYHLGGVVESPTYRRAERASLFLGLSDGARMDVFRRTAGLNNEQVWQAYELSGTKAVDMLKDLRKALNEPEVLFERVFLLDDFTASGRSYIRYERGEWKGKIAKAIRQFSPGGEANCLVHSDTYEMTIVLYVATATALRHIEVQLRERFSDRPRAAPKVRAVYELPPGSALDDKSVDDQDFLKLIDGDQYYRTRKMDEHENIGGTESMKRGFAGCSLPLVLSHNTPNNSVYLLFADPAELGSARGLFPRIARHKEVA